MTDDQAFRRPRADERFRGAFSVPAADSSDDSPTEVIPRIPDPPEIPAGDAPTDVIPRIMDEPEPEPSPREAPTEVIPRIVDTPRPAPPMPDPVPAPVAATAPAPVADLMPAAVAAPERESSGAAKSTRSSQRAAARTDRKVQRKLRILSGFGEVLISLGAVMALYVVYTLWWTNVEAHKAASAESNKIQQQFQQQLSPQGGSSTAPPPTVFQPSEGFGLMTIPAIGKTDIPIMEGTDKAKVLDKGAVGHYTTPKSAMPWDATGNFAVAAHRRTYGEPFRYINQLKVGDHVVVETSHGWFVYTLDKELPQTDPSNIGTIAPVPKGGPYTKPGKYITLTTCTPEWASTYRLIWWGHLERVDPLSGPPPAELKDPDRRG
ncbi:class E sortase [Catenulispora subtropica]|uniref:Sortase family protein n=1 Tax=Catenulispora subtropica TaxID=450798 RepID=A0ABP5BWH7_9ACTN